MTIQEGLTNFLRGRTGLEVREVALVAWAGALMLSAIALVAGLAASGASPGPVLPVLVLAALAFLGERQGIRIDRSVEISVSSLPLLFAAVVFGPLTGALVGAASLLSQFRAPYLRWTIWTGSRALSGGAAGFAAAAIQTTESWPLGALVLSAACAVMTQSVCEFFPNSVTVTIRGTGSIKSVARATAPILLTAAPIWASVVSVLAYAYSEISPVSVLFFLIPAFAAQRLFLLYQQQREMAEELVVANESLERANLSFAAALVATLDARDQYTAGHSNTVAVYARDIAARMGLSEADQRLAHLCGLVHDVGKIGLPAGLLEKPGALTLEERRHMERHSEIGEGILRNVDGYSEIAKIVRHHHERVDGNGYPDRISADEIPLMSRILAVADAYDAMTSDRPYRDAMPSRVARMRLAQAVESQFDTSVVAAFEAILASADEGYRTGGRRREPGTQDQYRAPVAVAAAS